MNQFDKEIIDWSIRVIALLEALTNTEAISHFESAWEFNDIVNPAGIVYFQEAKDLIKEAYLMAGFK